MSRKRNASAPPQPPASLRDLQILLAQERDQRAAKCMTEVNHVVARHHCRLLARVMIIDGRVESAVGIAALDVPQQQSATTPTDADLATAEHYDRANLP